MRALPRSKESIYEKDHDETERNSSGPGCGLGRVGSKELSDNLGGMT